MAVTGCAAGISKRARPVTKVVIEIVLEKPDGAGNRRSGHVNERAVAFAAVEIEDLLKLVVESRVAFALVDAVEDGGEHVRLHAASGTLAAGFAGEELSDPKRFFDHACFGGIKTHHAAAKTGAGLLKRCRVQRHIDPIRRQECARGTTRKDSLQLLAFF